MRGTEITSGNHPNALLASNTRRHTCLPLLLLLALLSGCRSERAAFQFAPISSSRNTVAPSQESVSTDSMATIAAAAKRQGYPCIAAIKPAAKLLSNIEIGTTPKTRQQTATIGRRLSVEAKYHSDRSTQRAIKSQLRHVSQKPEDVILFCLLGMALGLLVLIIGLLSSSLVTILVGLGVGIFSFLYLVITAGII